MLSRGKMAFRLSPALTLSPTDQCRVSASPLKVSLRHPCESALSLTLQTAVGVKPGSKEDETVEIFLSRKFSSTLIDFHHLGPNERKLAMTLKKNLS